MLFFTLRFHWAFFLFTHLLSRLGRNNLDSWWVLMQMDKYHLRIENSDSHKHFPRSFSWRPAHVPHGTLISLSLNFTFTGGIATCFISLSKQAGSSSSSSFLNGETRGRWKLLSKNRLQDTDLGELRKLALSQFRIKHWFSNCNLSWWGQKSKFYEMENVIEFELIVRVWRRRASLL